MFDVELMYSRNIPIDSLKALISTLLGQLPEKNSPVVIAVKPELPSPGQVNGQRQVTKGVVYDPTVVYILELATVLALRDEQTVEAVGKPIAEALQAVIRDAVNIHPTAVSRAVYYLLCILEASHVRPLYHDGSKHILISVRSFHFCVHQSSCMQSQVWTHPFNRNPLH